MKYMLGKSCVRTVIGRMLDRASRYAVNKLPASLDLIESKKKNQTLFGRVWIKFRFSICKILMLVKRCEILRGVKSTVVVTSKDCSIYKGDENPI